MYAAMRGERRAVVAPLVLIAALAAAAAAAVHQVPADAPTIQAGVDMAAAGDTVLVAPGTYSGPGNEFIDFGGTNLVLRSSGGNGLTTLQCTASDTCFLLHSGEDTTALIDGFTIRHAACAFALTDAGPKLRDCDTEYCRLAVGAVRSGAVITGCRFAGESWNTNHHGLEFEGLPGVTLRDCFFTDVWGAIELEGTSLIVWGGHFYRVGAYKKGAAVAGWSSDVEVHDVLVEESGPGAAFDNIGVAVYLEACSGLIDDCVFTRNGIWAGHTNYGTVTLDYEWHGTSEFEILNSVFLDNDVGSFIFPGSILSNARALVVEGCTIAEEDGINVAAGDSARIENTLVAFNDHGIKTDIGDALTVTHSCVYANTQGDSIPGAHSENLFEDPLFCHLEGGDVSLDDDSPCLPANNPWDVQIGARGVGCLTDVPEGPVNRFHLHRAAPNPSAGPFRLAFDVPVAEREVEIAIYNAAGRMVRTLRTTPGAPGRHALTWDGRAADGTRAAAGGYFARATCGDDVSRTTLMLVR